MDPSYRPVLYKATVCATGIRRECDADGRVNAALVQGPEVERHPPCLARVLVEMTLT